MAQQCENLNTLSCKNSSDAIYNNFTTIKNSSDSQDWQKYHTADGQKRGFIEMGQLADFWIHMGTKCNLSCPSCFEGSGSNPNRIETLNYAEVEPIILEALQEGVQKFSFTGGEPFIHADFIKILGLALEHRPCLVLTNATKPIENYLPELESFKQKPNKLYIRVSIDYADESSHDAGRGQGSFKQALKNSAILAEMGHAVSIARRKLDAEDESITTTKYQEIFKQFSLPQDTNIVAFPNLLLSAKNNTNPEITEHCMTAYKTKQERDNFMCCHCMMLTKKKGELCFYPCTLVNDDDSYILGNTLSKARESSKIILRHPRCFTCFAHGTSCVEPT